MISPRNKFRYISKSDCLSRKFVETFTPLTKQKGFCQRSRTGQENSAKERGGTQLLQTSLRHNFRIQNFQQEDDKKWVNLKYMKKEIQNRRKYNKNGFDVKESQERKKNAESDLVGFAVLCYVFEIKDASCKGIM